jgi:hypothetical protein
MAKSIRLIAAVSVLLACAACFPIRSAKPKKPPKVEGVAGRVLTSFSLSIDANYDPRLDGLIAGYKLLPVIVKNMSLRNVIMDAKRDKWVVVGEKGQRYAAYNTLRVKDPVLWREIPDKMRALIDYPEIVPINYSVTFDLLIPKKANLEYFREIHYYNAAWQQEFILEKEY